MKEFLSVKEFSDFTGVSVTTLRYWDNIGLFSPSERGKGNNYRYYSHRQTIMINFITVLSELAVPMKTIHSLYKNKTPEGVLRLLESHEYLLDDKLRKLQEMYSIIHTRSEMIREGLKADCSEISVVDMRERSIIVGPKNDFSKGGGFYEPFNNFYDYAEKRNVNLKFPIGGMHRNLDSFYKAPEKPQHFFSIDPVGNERKKAGKYLVGYVRGYYGELGELADRMKAFADKHGLRLRGPTYEIYLHDEVCMNNTDEYLAQVCIPVRSVTLV